jgi:hypothetical protein
MRGRSPISTVARPMLGSLKSHSKMTRRQSGRLLEEETMRGFQPSPALTVSSDYGVGSAPGGDRWLAYCVGDHAPLFEQTWPTLPVVNRGQPDKFSGVFSLDELSLLVSMDVIPISEVRLVSQSFGSGRPRINISNASHAGVLCAGGPIRDLIRQGYTLTIDGIQRFSTGLFRLCRGLESELSHRVSAGVYFTPASSQGFKPHYDEGHVIVLQLEGTKDWFVFSPETAEPFSGPQLATLPESKAPLIKVTLRAGDSLYIPRAFVHYAVATDQPSLHASVGVRLTKVADLVEFALSGLADSPILAHPLEPGFAARPGDLALALIQAAAHLGAQLGEGSTAGQSAAGFCRSRQRPVTSLHPTLPDKKRD